MEFSAEALAALQQLAVAKGKSLDGVSNDASSIQSIFRAENEDSSADEGETVDGTVDFSEMDQHTISVGEVEVKIVQVIFCARQL